MHRRLEGRGRSGRRSQAGAGRAVQGRRCRLEEVPAGSGHPVHGQHHQQPVPELPLAGIGPGLPGQVRAPDRERDPGRGPWRAAGQHAGLRFVGLGQDG
ncbi:hypothetical protein G6F68_021213 [Rhizopus microsporus]|nr:hypothetical protein G6F68_021213 [Rhizopus microsporus]